MAEVELGKRYKDTITGFEGVATARYEYLYGCTRIGLTGFVQGEPKDFAFDEPALEAVESVSLDPGPEARQTGGPKSAPSRTGH